MTKLPAAGEPGVVVLRLRIPARHLWAWLGVSGCISSLSWLAGWGALAAARYFYGYIWFNYLAPGPYPDWQTALYPMCELLPALALALTMLVTARLLGIWSRWWLPPAGLLMLPTLLSYSAVQLATIRPVP